MKKVFIDEFIKDKGLPDNAVFDGYILQRVDTDEFLSMIVDDEFSCVFGWTVIPDLAKRFTQEREPIAITKNHPEKSMIVSALFDLGEQNSVIPVHVDKHLQHLVDSIFNP